MVRLIFTFLVTLLCSGLMSQITPIEDIATDAFGKALITVSSSEANYYVLYHKETEESSFTYPIAMAIGEAGTTTLVDRLSTDALENYQVVGYPLNNPGDLDGDGISDIVEFQELGSSSPFNPAPSVDRIHGVTFVADTTTQRELSFFRSIDVLGAQLDELQTVKFYILDGETDIPRIYFLNGKEHLAHSEFASATNLPLSGKTYRGQINYHPNIPSTNGTDGAYRFRFQPTDIFPFEEIRKIQKILSTHLGFINNNLCYYPLPAALDAVAADQDIYDNSRVCLLYENDLYGDLNYLPLNITEGFGVLRVLEENETPFATDIVILEAIPNELSRVGGIITTVPQTPLAHVNLRAIQDQVPNSFIRNVLEVDSINNLIGNYVYYNVTSQGYTILPSTKEAVDAHFEALRPVEEQTPPRNLTETRFKSLTEIAFGDSDAYGVKCANVATMLDFGFPTNTTPSGYGIPFYYYDAFMLHNGFYEVIAAQLLDDTFINDIAVQEDWLKDFRDEIEDAELPDWMWDDLTALQESFPVGTSIRCRSSSNNEDLPGFSGAGLYDSKTQHPDEGHLSKSVKQVFASIWNFRAFREREFYRIDHLTTAMGVLCHPNFEEETVNGVAVSLDPLNGTEDYYYVNSQKGEDLVTNPEASSIPEEQLIHGEDDDIPPVILRLSNLNEGEELLTEDQRKQLRSFMTTVHDEFLTLYNPDSVENFGMEIEFKVTAEDQLIIKQARPWAGYWTSLESVEPPTAGTNIDVQLFPNPTLSHINMQFTLEQAGALGYNLYNNQGERLINAVSKNYGAGEHTLVIVTDTDFSPGLYTLVVDWQGEQTVHKFVKASY